VNALVLVDKPSGLSSNQVLSRLKRLLGMRKMGFVGTLDPLATGVLPVLTGKATRLIPLFEGQDKTYRVTVKLGQRTNTMDSEGEVIEEAPAEAVAAVTEAAFTKALLAHQGETEQTVPAFSAVKIQGTPAYKLARKGEEVPTRTRTVAMWGMEMEAFSPEATTFVVSCTAGTYMRALVEAIGLELGVGAHMTALRRLQSGKPNGTLFSLQSCYTLERIESMMEEGLTDFWVNPATQLPLHEAFEASEEAIRHIQQGQAFEVNAQGLTSGQPAMALDTSGNLLAVGEITPGNADTAAPGQWLFQPRKVLV